MSTTLTDLYTRWYLLMQEYQDYHAPGVPFQPDMADWAAEQWDNILGPNAKVPAWTAREWGPLFRAGKLYTIARDQGLPAAMLWKLQN